MNLRCIAGLLAVFALLVGACTSNPQASNTHKPASSTAASAAATGAPPQASQPEVDVVKDAAFQYYVSPERRALLQEVLDTVGMELARDMIAGRIPAKPKVWQKGDPRKPVNEYGLLQSLTYNSNSAASVVVKFTNGRVDLTAGVLSIDIARDGVNYVLDGKYVLDDHSQPIENAAGCFAWSRRDNPNTDTDLYVAYRNGSPVDGLKPLEPNPGLYEIGGFSRQDYRVPVNEQEIKQKDAEFINQIKALV